MSAKTNPRTLREGGQHAPLPPPSQLWYVWCHHSFYGTVPGRLDSFCGSKPNSLHFPYSSILYSTLAVDLTAAMYTCRSSRAAESRPNYPSFSCFPPTSYCYTCFFTCKGVFFFFLRLEEEIWAKTNTQPSYARRWGGQQSVDGKENKHLRLVQIVRIHTRMSLSSVMTALARPHLTRKATWASASARIGDTHRPFHPLRERIKERNKGLVVSA